MFDSRQSAVIVNNSLYRANQATWGYQPKVIDVTPARRPGFMDRERRTPTTRLMVCVFYGGFVLQQRGPQPGASGITIGPRGVRTSSIPDNSSTMSGDRPSCLAVEHQVLGTVVHAEGSLQEQGDEGCTGDGQSRKSLHCGCVTVTYCPAPR